MNCFFKVKRILYIIGIIISVNKVDEIKLLIIVVVNFFEIRIELF